MQFNCKHKQHREERQCASHNRLSHYRIGNEIERENEKKCNVAAASDTMSTILI